MKRRKSSAGRVPAKRSKGAEATPTVESAEVSRREPEPAEEEQEHGQLAELLQSLSEEPLQQDVISNQLTGLDPLLSSGLTSSQLNALLQRLLLCAPRLSTANLTALLDGLVPRQRVPGAVARDWLLEALWAYRADAEGAEAVDDGLSKTERLRRLRNGQRMAERALQWTNYLLHYSLCSPKDIQCLYDILMQMVSMPKLRIPACDLLSTLTECRHVTSQRTTRLQKYVSRKDQASGPIHLLRKYRSLRPDLATQGPLPKRSAASGGAGAGAKDVLGRRFQAFWQNRTPLFEDAAAGAGANVVPVPDDDLNREARLNWDDYAAERTEDGKNRKYDIPVPSASPRPQDRLPKSAVPLVQCRTVAELYQNLLHLVTPARSLGYLRNKSTFFLLVANENPEQVQERFAITLYHTLYNEFFGMKKGSLERRRYLLRRILSLEDFLQLGIPVVAAFLVEYLEAWDGQELFMEVMPLLAYIQITDYEELEDCVLSHLTHHFQVTFSAKQRLLCLFFVQQLLLHWIFCEYGRCCSANKEAAMAAAATSAAPKVTTNPSVGSASSPPSPSSKALQQSRRSRALFGASHSEFRRPLHSIHRLIGYFLEQAELGMTKVNKTDRAVYFNEVLTMCMMITTSLVKKDIPLRVELPANFVYYSLFHGSPIFLNRVLRHIWCTKHEIIPLCRSHLKRMEAEARRKRRGVEDGDEGEDDDEDDSEDDDEEDDDEDEVEERAVVRKQFEDKDQINAVTKDVLASLCNGTVYLERGQSIFRQSFWQVEEDEIRRHLSLSSHVALMPHVYSFAKTFANDNRMDLAKVHAEMEDETSYVHQAYRSFLMHHHPFLTDFLDTFAQSVETRRRLADAARPKGAAETTTTTTEARSEYNGSQKSGATTTNSSGVSSMLPTVALARLPGPVGPTKLPGPAGPAKERQAERASGTSSGRRHSSRLSGRTKKK